MKERRFTRTINNASAQPGIACAKADAQYQHDKETTRILERRVSMLTAEIERMRREYRISLIDYEREQLGTRAA